jgi:hypothetical protein
MTFCSSLYSSEVIINESTPIDSVILGPDGEPFGRGLDLGLRGPGDYEYGDTAEPFPSYLLIPESEWEPRIREMEAQGTRLSDLIRKRKSPCKNQSTTNFCWFNTPTRCAEIVMMKQRPGLPVELSPASGACPVTNFRNVGGWPRDALAWIVECGLNDVIDWPANAIDRRYATASNKAKALENRVLEWIELKPRTKQQLISLLLRRIPVCCGYNWWGHATTAIDPVWLDGTAATRSENSWGPSYGDQGFFILQGSRLLPDDACAPKSVLAS